MCVCVSKCAHVLLTFACAPCVCVCVCVCMHMLVQSPTSSQWVWSWWVWGEAEDTAVLDPQKNALIQHILPAEPLQPEGTTPGNEWKRNCYLFIAQNKIK